jgi:outer membrane lipoprotein-sorting protein
MTNRQSPQRRSPRHIPSILRALGIGLAASLPLAASAQEPQQPAAQTPQQPAVEPADLQPVADTDAAILLEKSRETLGGYRTLKAHMTETVEFGPRRMKAEGTYLQGPDHRLRIELEVAIGENKGTLLQISEGDVLWTVYDAGPTPRITRRDVNQILAVAKNDQAKAAMSAELGLGGLSSLLTAVEQSMQFEQPLATKIDGRDFYVLEGTWKPAIAKQFQQQANNLPNPTTEQRPLPAHIPDLVRLYLDAETHFPYRIRYLKRGGAAGQPPVPLLTIDFRDIVVNASLDPNEFRYSAPKDAEVRDVTNLYVPQTPAGQAAPPVSPLAPTQK